MSGVFVTKVDVFFQSKDENIPVLFELRDTKLGTPTENVLPFSAVSIDPKDVNVSEDGTVATTITLKAPVYLNPQKEYAMVLLSHSTEYRVWISRLGEADVTSTNQEAGQILVTEQPLLGSLFKSQNASVWTPSQYEDLKFTMYVANFKTQGNVSMFNPELPTDLSQIDTNGLTIESRQIRLGLNKLVNDAGLVAFAGSASSNLSITNAGVGYTPSSGGFTYTGIALTAITGKGVNATADITINSGVAIAATVNAGGSGYVVGDVLTPVGPGSLNLGSGIQLSVDSTLGNNTLVLDNVQGNFTTNASYPLYYENAVGFTTELNGVGGAVLPTAPIRINHEGSYIRVFQRNHGLYANVNRVTLSDIRSDAPPQTLAVEYPFNATTFITLSKNAINSGYATFENIGVGGTNPGYVKIGDEIISYTGTNGRTLTGITRGVDNTIITRHNTGELVYKYELDGVSLRRINTEHQLANVNTSELEEAPIGLDYYYVKVQMNANGINRAPANAAGFPPLYFTESKLAGGPFVKGSYNLPFSLITPKVTTITPLGTNLISQARTISAASVSGSQESYLDKGFKQVTLFDKNYFDDLMMVASPQNEALQLNADTFPGKKSFAMNFTLLSSDPRISPVIDLDNASVVFTSNRVNRPVTDYAGNFKVNGVSEDPDRFIYVSKNIELENPATSLQVLLDAYVSNFGDIRVFYALNQTGPVQESIFVPFPGFKNKDINGSILNIANNNGTPDKKVPKVDSYSPEPLITEYREYKFSVDDISPFTSFRIKIIGTSTDQANAPFIRSLRALSFA